VQAWLLFPLLLVGTLAEAHTARPLRCAFVMTHQLGAFMKATERPLEAFLPGEPFVVLRLDRFGALTPSLWRRATHVLSDLPKWFPFDADEVHLAGGYVPRCLTVTAHKVLETVFRGDRREVTLVVHADLSYMPDERPLWAHVSSLEEAAIEAGRAFFPPWDPVWKPLTTTTFTDGTRVVHLRAILGAD
jgi:hypothetical protein